MAQVGVGIAMGVLAPIPIVGQIAVAIGAVAQVLMSLFSQPREVVVEILPPLQDYKDEVDQWVVNNQVLPATTTLDWTGLLKPRFQGPWAVHGREGANAAMHGAVGSAGLGFMPGTQRMTSIIQTYWADRGRLNVVSPELSSRATDVGSFYPGASQIMTALQEQCAKPQPQMYNVDTIAIEDAWDTYIRYAFELAEGIYKREKWAVQGTPLANQTREQNQRTAQAMMSRLLVGVGKQIGAIGAWTWRPEDPRDNSVFEVFIKPWCRKVRKRQENNLGRIPGAAYTSEEQGAFRDHELLVKLRTMRAILLQHPARNEVVLEDVIDPEFRSALFDATVGQRLAAGPPVAVKGGRIDPATPKDPPPPGVGGGVPFGRPDSGRIGWLVLLAAAGIGAYAARRKRWI
jgi:hypothetical protein